MDNAWGGGPSPALGGFPDAAIYLSESGSDARVPGAYGTRLRRHRQRLHRQLGRGRHLRELQPGLWDQSNDALCTLVAPGTYTLASCAAHIPGGSTGASPDYVDNCRWKSQNISVADNTFNFTASNIGSDCTTANTCGYNGLFSEGGTTPSTTTNGPWPSGASYPYAGYTVPNNISNHQNNRFADNLYCSRAAVPWRFVGFTQGTSMSASQWTSGARARRQVQGQLRRAGRGERVHVGPVPWLRAAR